MADQITPDQMMRQAGRGPDGLAKAIQTNLAGDLRVDQNANTLIDGELTATTLGFHSFGETIGRGHQKILNISRYKTLNIMVESPASSLAEPGNMQLLFFNENGRITNGTNPRNDTSLVYNYDLLANKNVMVTPGSRFNFNSFEYIFLDVSSFMGMIVNFSSMPANSTVKVKVVGGL